VIQRVRTRAQHVASMILSKWSLAAQQRRAWPRWRCHRPIGSRGCRAASTHECHRHTRSLHAAMVLPGREGLLLLLVEGAVPQLLARAHCRRSRARKSRASL